MGLSDPRTPRRLLGQRLRAWLHDRRAEIKLALRVAIAGIATFALARWLDMAQGVWAVITAVIVVQTSIGGSVKAAIERSIGTLAGALYGGMVGWLLPHGSIVGLGAAIAVSLAPLAFLAAMDPRFRVAPVTALIIVFTASPEVTGALHSGFDRILEIALGNVIGVAVSVFVLPARAHFMLAQNAAEVVAIQAQLVVMLLGGGTGPDEAELQRLRARTRATLKKLEAAADEAKRERQIHLSNEPDPEPLVRTLYRLRHDLVMIGRACAVPFPETLVTRLGPPTAELGRRLHDFMEAQAASMRVGGPPASMTSISVALKTFSAGIEAARADGLTRGVAVDAIGRLFTLRFALDQLEQDLADLVGRADEEATT